MVNLSKDTKDDDGVVQGGGGSGGGDDENTSGNRPIPRSLSFESALDRSPDFSRSYLMNFLEDKNSVKDVDNKSDKELECIRRLLISSPLPQIESGGGNNGRRKTFTTITSSPAGYQPLRVPQLKSALEMNESRSSYTNFNFQQNGNLISDLRHNTSGGGGNVIKVESSGVIGGPRKFASISPPPSLRTQPPMLKKISDDYLNGNDEIKRQSTATVTSPVKLTQNLNYSQLSMGDEFLPSPKAMTYYYIIQQLKFDGYNDIAANLLKRANVSMPDSNASPVELAPSDVLEQLMAYIIYNNCGDVKGSQNSTIATGSTLTPPRNGCRNYATTEYGMNGQLSPNEYIREGASIHGDSLSWPSPPHPDVFMSEEYDGKNISADYRLRASSMIPPGVGSGISSSDMRNDCNNLQVVCKFGSVGSGPGQLQMPHGFCLGVDGQIVIADTNNHRISIFGSNGAYLFSFGNQGVKDGQLYLPRKVAMLPPPGIQSEMEPVYVVCDRGAKRSRMQIFSLRGEFIRGIHIPYMDIVSGLCTTPERHIVVVDSVRSGVSILNENGQLLYWFTCASEMNEPSDLAVHNNEYYICDFKGHCVNVFNQHGVRQRRIASPHAKFPNGIDISANGHILVGNSHGNKFHVSVFASDGTPVGEYDCPFVKVSRCCGLKLNEKGRLFTLAKNNNHVLVIDSINSAK